MATKKATTKAKTKTAKAAAKAAKKPATVRQQTKPTVVEAAAETQWAEPAAAVKVPGPVAVTATPASGDFLRLRSLNLWLALGLAVQAAVILIFGGAKATPLTVQYPAVDQLASDVAGHPVTAIATHHLFDMRLSLTAAKALLVLALASVIIATVGRKYYEQQLQRGSNVARWLSFGLGGGLMVIALGQLAGFTDLALLASMLLLTVAGFSLAPLAEKFKREKRGGRLPHALCAAAITAAVAPWVVLAGAVAGSLLWGGTVPSGFYGMAGATALFFGCWALASHFRARNQGKWADTIYAEKMYMFLTVAAASVLAWQIFVEAL